MNKLKWLELSDKEKVIYVEDTLDKLQVVTDHKEKKELENKIFDILEFEESHE
jgi:hypothetical protein